MSQIVIYDTSSIMGDVESLTGNTGGAVGPDGAGNINIIGPDVPTIINGAITTENGFISVTGNPGTNTQTIAPVNTVQVVAQTSDATLTTVYSLTVQEEESIFFKVKYIGAYSDYSEALGGDRQTVATRQLGGGTSQFDSGGFTSKTFNIPFDTDLSITTSGNDVIFQVKGEAGTDYNWKIQIEYIRLGKAS